MKGVKKMEILNIRELLIKYGYNKSSFVIRKKKIDIPNVYIKEDKEAYLILEYSFLKQKIEEYQRRILWFQNCSDNEIIKYNINIIITYNSSKITDENRFVEDIKKYERDLNICRKIFIDLDDENSINILPFLNIDVEGTEEEETRVITKIKDIIKNSDVISELLKEKPDFESIEGIWSKEK